MRGGGFLFRLGIDDFGSANGGFAPESEADGAETHIHNAGLLTYYNYTWKERCGALRGGGEGKEGDNKAARLSQSGDKADD